MNTEIHFLPEQASTFAGDVDMLYAFLLLISAIFTVLIAFLIFFFAIKYRRGSTADRTQGTTNFFLMELSWIGIPLVLTMIMFFWGAHIFFHEVRPPAGAMEINCVGKQWMWKFQHPEGRSEINDLHVPLGQAVRVNLISEDVIHSLYFPAFRVKHDVLPGRYTSLWFEPTQVGTYHLFCAEYCGAKHSEMRGTVHVMEPSKYAEWLAGGGATQSTAEAGKALFEQLRCNTCHLPANEKGRGPSLQGIFNKRVALQNGDSVIADENYLRESILRPAAKIVAGYQSVSMPSFEGQIGEEGLLQLIAEIKSQSLPTQQRPDPTEDTPPPGGDRQLAPPATDLPAAETDPKP